MDDKSLSSTQPTAPTAAAPKSENPLLTVQNPFKPPTPQAAAPGAASSSVPPTPSQPPAGTPPGFIKGGGGLKKLIIGVVVVVIITILVVMFLPRASSQKVKLVWWGLWEDAQVMEPLIADFQRKNPNITIEYVKQDQNQYGQKLKTRIAAGTGPDIYRFHNTWYPMLSDILLPLSNDVITQEDFKKNYYPVMQTDLVHNGGIYGIPLGADTLALFVNTDLFEAAGASVPSKWEDFVKVAKQLTVKDENNKIQTAGAAFGTYANITHASDIISLLFIQQGVDLNKFEASEADATDALDFYTSFTNGEQNTWNGTLDDSLLFFSQGKLAMYFGYSWDIFAIQKLNKDLHFKTYPVPSLFNRNMTIASYWVEGVSAKSAHQKEAFMFMQYLAQKETAQKFYTEAAKTRAFGEPYARVDLADTLKDNELVYPFVQQLKTATSSYLVSDTHDGDGGINSASTLYLGNAINALVNDGTSPPTVLDTLTQGLAQTLLKYGIQ
jgi:multiple sugar transport system substrate-binding protein